MELLGTRSTTRASTMAACPHHKFLVAGPAAREHSGYAGEGSRVEILRLWRGDEEPERGRELEVLGTIQAPGDVSFLGLAWSGRDANLAYLLGLLAGALDGGAVCVWDPSLLPYKFDTNLVPKKFHSEYKKEVEHGLSNMLLGFDNILESKFSVKATKESNSNAENDNGDSDDWEFVPGKSEIDLDDWEIIPNKTAKAVDHSSRNGLLLKFQDMKGPILGLSFNNPYGNVLVCGGLGEKLSFYYLDSPVKTCEMVDIGSKEVNSQITCLDWHPVYPLILASACDASVAKIWDLRAKKPICRFDQENKGLCTEAHWNPNKPLEIAVASAGTLPALHTIEIWDARNSHVPLSKFGPKNGVISLSWCADPNMIFTTDLDGAANAWKLNEIGSSNTPWTRYDTPDRISLHPEGKNEILWCHSDDVIAISSSRNIGLYKLKT